MVKGVTKLFLSKYVTRCGFNTFLFLFGMNRLLIKNASRPMEKKANDINKFTVVHEQHLPCLVCSNLIPLFLISVMLFKFRILLHGGAVVGVPPGLRSQLQADLISRPAQYWNQGISIITPGIFVFQNLTLCGIGSKMVDEENECLEM